MKTKEPKMHRISFLTLLLLCICNSALSQKQLAITMDDPNTYNTPALGWEERNNAILETLDKHGIKSALFVCGSRVDDANGNALLEKWDQKDHLICNHSYSHLYYNSKKVSPEAYIDDFKKGDSIVAQYENYTRLFRYPFLKEGNTVAKRDAMRGAMEEHSYRNGHVSIDASDWYIDSKINALLKEDPNADLTPYKEYYINHILDRANYYDSLATKLFNRKIRHTLLIHHSLLNALFLDDLLTALKEKGWSLINAEDAYRDEIYDLQPEIQPCGESIVWQCAKTNPDMAETLRYPAEDGTYEELPLQTALEQYEQKKKP